MSEFDPTLLGALRVQLGERERRLARGADHVGWKLGVGRRERIGDSIAVGHLTSETLLTPAAAYHARPDEDLHADAEVMIVLGHDLADPADHDQVRDAISSCGAALEIVDLQQRPGEPASVVAGNVFHRAVAMAPLPLAVSAGVEAALGVNGAGRGGGRGSGQRWSSGVPGGSAGRGRTISFFGSRKPANCWLGSVSRCGPATESSWAR